MRSRPRSSLSSRAGGASSSSRHNGYAPCPMFMRMALSFLVGAYAGIQISPMTCGTDSSGYVGAGILSVLDQYQQQPPPCKCNCPCLDADARGTYEKDPITTMSEESIFESLEEKHLLDGGTLLWDPQNHAALSSGSGLAMTSDCKESDAEEQLLYTLPPSVLAKLDDETIDPDIETRRCAEYGFAYDESRKARRRLFYGSMISDEAVQVLQTVATEVRDVFHTVAFIESNITGAFMPRDWRFPPHSKRRRMLGTMYGDSTKVTVDYYIHENATESFVQGLRIPDPLPAYKQIMFEHQIRQQVLKRWHRNGMQPDDVAVFGDADETFSRDFLRALQMCDVPEFRPGQDCKAPKILGTAHVFEASPECVVDGMKLWKPDALIGECLDTIGNETLHPPPKRVFKGKQNFRLDGHGRDGNTYDQYFAMHGARAEHDGKKMYPLWTPADIRGVSGGRQVPKRVITAFHLHNSFKTGEELRNKYLKYAEDIPRAASAPLSLIHEDIALAVACVHGWKDMGKTTKRLVGGFSAINGRSGSSPILYQDKSIRKSMHNHFKNLVAQDEIRYGSANGACKSWRCDYCDRDVCDMSKIPSYQSPRRRFSASVSSIATGAATISRDEFFSAFDHGFPLPTGSQQTDDGGAKDVLMLYRGENTLPKGREGTAAATFFSTDNGGNAELPSLSVDSATAHCDNVLVVNLRNPFDERAGEAPKQCLALTSGYGGPNIYRWKATGHYNETLSLLDGNGMNSRRFKPEGIRGRFMDVPSVKSSELHRSGTLRYLQSLDEALDTLRPILENIARKRSRRNTKEKGTVVIMAANKGFSSLISNFCCTSLANGIDLSNVLIFATDTASYENAQALGLSAFHTEKYLGPLPEEAAAEQSNPDFNAMTLAKVVGVHMSILLGYDILFQDADVVWYRDPTEYFLQDGLAGDRTHDVDIMFMDDGNPLNIFAPYRANTGFYFARSNDRTRYLFQNLIFAADQIVAKNDQLTMAALLPVHIGLHGLRAKTLDWRLFPGGREYQGERSFVEDVVLDGKPIVGFPNDTRPYIFHMHWTQSRDIKLVYMKQSGMWHLRDKCFDKSVKDVLPANRGNERVNSTHTAYASLCCSSTPLISCNDNNSPQVAECRKKG